MANGADLALQSVESLYSLIAILIVENADPNYQMLNAVKATRQGLLYARLVTLTSSFQQQPIMDAHRWHRETILKRGPNIASLGRRVNANRQLNLLRLDFWLPRGDLRAIRRVKIHRRLRWAPWHNDTVTSNGCTRDISCRTTKVKLCLICTQRLQRH